MSFYIQAISYLSIKLFHSVIESSHFYPLFFSHSTYIINLVVDNFKSLFSQVMSCYPGISHHQWFLRMIQDSWTGLPDFTQTSVFHFKSEWAFYKISQFLSFLCWKLLDSFLFLLEQRGKYMKISCKSLHDQTNCLTAGIPWSNSPILPPAILTILEICKMVPTVEFPPPLYLSLCPNITLPKRSFLA